MLQIVSFPSGVNVKRGSSETPPYFKNATAVIHWTSGIFSTSGELTSNLTLDMTFLDGCFLSKSPRVVFFAAGTFGF